MTQILFPGFSREFVETPRGRFFLRRAGRGGTPLLLLHGFPQSHAEWSETAPALSADRPVIAMDLVGYGESDAPPGDDTHTRYSKLAMAEDCLAVLDALGIDRFSVAGHDRGALVAMRLALLAPERVEKLVILDNIPTFLLWERIRADPTLAVHWRTMPLPTGEAMLTREWLETLMKDHGPTRSLDFFPPEALALYRKSWEEPARIHAFCEDYRAGAGPDPELDRADFDAGRRITRPTLVIWGEYFFGKDDETPVDAWRRTLIPDAKGVEVPRGHFNPEESPEETLAAMSAFLR